MAIDLSHVYTNIHSLENYQLLDKGAVHNLNNHNPCRSKSQHQNPNRYEIPTNQNPNKPES